VPGSGCVSASTLPEKKNSYIARSNVLRRPFKYSMSYSVAVDIIIFIACRSAVLVSTYSLANMILSWMKTDVQIERAALRVSSW
jgi:hypothetical protein